MSDASLTMELTSILKMCVEGLFLMMLTFQLVLSLDSDRGRLNRLLIPKSGLLQVTELGASDQRFV